MLTVHHLNNSRSQRVLWLLEELGVPDEIKFYRRGADMRALGGSCAPFTRSANRLLSPITTPSSPSSGAIIAYLIETYGDGRLVPAPKTPEKLRYTYWLHYAEGSAMPLLVNKLIFTVLPEHFPTLLRPLGNALSKQLLAAVVDPDLTRHMDFWETELNKTAWFAGSDFTAADIQMSFRLEAAAARAS